MNIIIAVILVATALVLIILAFKLFRIFLRMFVWVVIAAVVIALVNYLALPALGLHPVKLGFLEKAGIAVFLFIKNVIAGIFGHST